MLRFPYPTRRGNKPGYKGVRPSHDKFAAQVHRGGRRFHLGTYENEHHAAWAVNLALGRLFQDLPDRFLNHIPKGNAPSLKDQESIRKEVLLRLSE